MPRIRSVGGVSPLPFFIRDSSFKRSNHWGTKNVLKWNRALGFEFSIQSSVHGAITVAKVSLILYLDTVYCKFLLHVSVEIDPFSCEQTSAI